MPCLVAASVPITSVIEIYDLFHFVLFFALLARSLGLVGIHIVMSPLLPVS